jgi:hypothetical protein
VGKELTFHDAAGAYPLMSDAELDALAEDLRVNGQQVPIVTWRGAIIDGRNRYLACKRAGIECQTVEYQHGEETIPAAVESLNEHRRHLSEEWRRKRRQERIERIARIRQLHIEGVSKREIAREVGIDEKQVRRHLSGSGADILEMSAPERVTGGDGKSYPASGVARATPDPDDVAFEAPAGHDPEPDPEAAFEPPTLSPEEQQEVGENYIRMAAEGALPENLEAAKEAARPKDGADLPIPDGMVAAFAEAEKFDECMRLLRAAQKFMSEIAAGPAGGHLMRELSHKKGKDDSELRHYCEAIANAQKKLKFGRPFACVCPYCLDVPKADCKSCQGNGWVTESCWKDAPEDFREAAASARLAAREEQDGGGAS